MVKQHIKHQLRRQNISSCNLVWPHWLQWVSGNFSQPEVRLLGWRAQSCRAHSSAVNTSSAVLTTGPSNDQKCHIHTCPNSYLGMGSRTTFLMVLRWFSEHPQHQSSLKTGWKDATVASTFPPIFCSGAVRQKMRTQECLPGLEWLQERLWNA